MHRARELVVVLLALVLVSGCGSAGKKWDRTHARDVKKGQPKTEIRAWFGDPYRTEAISNPPAVLRWTYTYAHSVVFAGTSAYTLVVDFDRDEKVCDHAYSEQE